MRSCLRQGGEGAAKGILELNKYMITPSSNIYPSWIHTEMTFGYISMVSGGIFIFFNFHEQPAATGHL